VLHEAEARLMTLPQRVLVVVPSRPLAKSLAATLKSAGYAPIVVSDFVVAKTLLEARPDFLISELKLGAYNGLQLAIHAAGQGTPTLIIGDADPVLQAEAERYRAAFLKTPFDPERILVFMRASPASQRPKRRSARKQVGVLDAYVNDMQARLLDVSYEGMRIETTEEELAVLPPRFTVRLPLFNFSCRVQRVWTARPIGDGSGMACGATAMAWRILVDALPGAMLTT
jgi:DNA-binding response OmpR family regulator